MGKNYIVIVKNDLKVNLNNLVMATACKQEEVLVINSKVENLLKKELL